MSKIIALPVLLILAILIPGCSSGSIEPSKDVSGSRYGDIEAMEINEYTPREHQFCVGRRIDPKFTEYDDQCQDAVGKGKCVQMPNPHQGNSYYCSLCGLKGTNMVCYLISPEG